MKDIYYDLAHRVTMYTYPLDPEALPDGVATQPGDSVEMVAGVATGREYRGRGYATAVLKELLRDADEESVHLLLSVQPDYEDDPDGLNSEQLTRWYERYGFRSLPEPTVMYRPPASRRV